MHHTAAHADRREEAQKRLATLASLHATAPRRLAKSVGFLASLDADAVGTYLASESPESIGGEAGRKRA
ncbi:MAG TPA: hypothetical protein VEX86_10880 [Longimicrobium sp.]|nr:hypothetical protein [Longimicrobium sp.]